MCLNGRSYGERLAKEACWPPATRGLKKDSDRAITSTVEGHHQDPHKPSSCTTFMLNSHWGRADTGKKSLTSVLSGSLWLCPGSLRPCRLWPARLLCQGEGFSRQEYWSVLANTGCRTLLEHCISCSPSRQLPWVPGAARTPATQATASPPSIPGPHRGRPKSCRAALGANPSEPPTYRSGNKNTIETQGQCG